MAEVGEGSAFSGGHPHPPQPLRCHLSSKPCKPQSWVVMTSFPKSFGTVHCIGHRERTTDNAIRRHAELAERFDTEDDRLRRNLVWDGSLSFASWPADADSTPGLEGWLVQQGAGWEAGRRGSRVAYLPVDMSSMCNI